LCGSTHHVITLIIHVSIKISLLWVQQAETNIPSFITVFLFIYLDVWTFNTLGGGGFWHSCLGILSFYNFEINAQNIFHSLKLLFYYTILWLQTLKNHFRAFSNQIWGYVYFYDVPYISALSSSNYFKQYFSQLFWDFF